MQEPLGQIVIFYYLFFMVVTIIFWMVRKVSKSKLFVFIYIVLLISPSFLYIPVEIDTFLYGKEFKNVEINTGWNLPVIYYKVFYINDKEAKLFYVEGENGRHDIGNFYHFVKVDGKWKFHKWGRTMWSNLGGNASEVTFPPYF